MKKLIILALSLSLFSCSVSEGTAQAAEPMADMAVASGTHTVKCGCAIEEVGHCDNYIEVDGQFVMIANSEELGIENPKMEWCKSGPGEAVAAGAIKDGKFVGTSLVVAE
ncbi:MAG: hypothetical protein ACI8X5_002911 [Planctomycetota bacterium]|jgi:hypothetical protein